MSFFEIYGQQKTLTQWDVGRKLIINEACDYVHYANEAMTEAIVCKVTENGGVMSALIPDEVLQTSGTLQVYAFVLSEEGYTRKIQSFYVKHKPKPVNYVYTPTEVMTWEGLHERVETLEAGGGAAGGYYLPAVEQVDETTVKVSFTASGEEMPEVAQQSLTLPAGPQGSKGDTGSTGPQGPQDEKGDTGADGVGIQSIYITEV